MLSWTKITNYTIFLLFSGCAARYPMGMDEKTWQSLSPQRRAELREKEAMEEAKLKAMREKLRHEERMRELAIEAKKEERLRILYHRAGYGDIVRINISGGCIKAYKTCEPYRPVSILLVRGETKRVKLAMRYGEVELWVRYNETGITIDDDRDLDDFDAAVLLPERWNRGRHYRISLADEYRKGKTTLTGATVFVRYFPTATTTSNCR